MRSGPVIVGVDGDASARDAVALGNRLAELLEAPLDVITVSSSSPAEALRDAAAAEDAALVVFGPTHRGPVARTLRGTARRLFAEAPCPVAVAPAGFADRPESPLRRIGVGYEPTPEGAGALAEAHALAARAGGSLRAIGVALPLAPLAYDDFGDVNPYLENEYRIVEAGLERALAQLPVTVPSTADARVGDPAVELAATSGELDVLVCGTRRRSPLRAILLGSVTERLLHDARCALLIVPRPANHGSTHETHRVRSATGPSVTPRRR